MGQHLTCCKIPACCKLPECCKLPACCSCGCLPGSRSKGEFKLSPLATISNSVDDNGKTKINKCIFI